MWHIFFIVLTLQMVNARAEKFICNSQADCQEGYSCSENACKKCLKCEFVFRMGNSCVFDFNECGDCLDGYEEVLVTDFSSVVKPCSSSKNKVKYKECIDDDNCPPNNYCKEESCFRCFNCSFLNRLTPYGKCAHSMIECGPCLRGYSEVALTTETNFKPCQKELHDFHEISKSQFSFTFLLLSCFIFALVFLGFYIVVYNRYKNQSSSKSLYREQIYPSAPPLSSVESPQFIRRHMEDISLVSFVKELKQKAKVFKLPDAPYYYNGEEENDAASVPLPNSENPVPVSLHPPVSAQLLEPQEPDWSSGLLSNGHLETEMNNDDLIANSQSHILDVVDSSQVSDPSSDETSANTLPDPSSDEASANTLPVSDEEEKEETLENNQ